MSTIADELSDLAGRILFTHRIDPKHLGRVLGVTFAEAQAVADGGICYRHLSDGEIARLELFVSILVRLEWRLEGDSACIRDVLDTPLEVLGHVAPADMLGGSLDDLRAVRRAIDTIAAPKVRWWRVGH